jgi:aspartyl-tRNA(Asn)/glutamyl-tRNA(Gln) amidotransferase subunit C
MGIARETVRHTALLARLELSEEQIERYAEELSAVVDFVSEIDALGLEGVEPLERVHDRAAEPQADEARPSPLSRAEVLAQAPATDGTYFLVPPAVEYLEP